MSYDVLTEDVLRKCFEKKSEESKEVVTLDILDDLVQKELHINKCDTAAKYRIENLFISRHKLLRRHGLSWIVNDYPKVAVRHVLFALRLDSLNASLEFDLEFSHYYLHKTFK